MNLTPIYILHTRPFRNTSLLVEVLSETEGRIALVARSARGPKSRYQGQLQLFTPMVASWRGKSELKNLNQCELQGMPFQLNQTALFCGFYLNELLIRLLHKEDAYPCVFKDYEDTLTALEKGEPLSKTLRLFEKRLLQSLGYALPLQQKSLNGAPIEAHRYYHFYPQEGFALAEAQPDAFLGEDLIAIANDVFTDHTLKQSKRLMRMALSFLLGDKPLYSRMLF